MSTPPRPIPSDPPGPSSWHQLLGSMVYNGGPVTIMTSRGPIICLDEATYTQLSRPAATSTAVAQLGIPRQPSTRSPRPAVRLTPRELQVLQTVATCESTAEVAERLGVVLNTVAQHLVAVRRKYGVHSTAEALTAARADGHPLPVSNGT